MRDETHTTTAEAEDLIEVAQQLHGSALRFGMVSTARPPCAC